MPYISKEFTFQNALVRVYEHDGSSWFVAKDVCNILELANNRDAISELEDDEKITVANPDGNPRNGVPNQFVCISESGLYALIFKSRKPQARAFRKWVTSEVLPQIRRTGSYSAVPAPATVSRYPFFNRPDCVEALSELARLGTEKLLTREDLLKILFEVAPVKKWGIGPRSAALDQFIELNLSFRLGAFEKTTAVHARYLECVGDDLTRNKLTRYLVTHYPDIAVKQKKLDGYPVQVYWNVAMTAEAVKIGQPVPRNVPAIEQRN
jgi:Prophage antirepressor